MTWAAMPSELVRPRASDAHCQGWIAFLRPRTNKAYARRQFRIQQNPMLLIMTMPCDNFVS